MRKDNIKKVIIVLVSIVVIFVGGVILYKEYRIRHAKVFVVLKDDLSAEVFSKVKISDYIVKINGKLLKDNYIDTSKLGVVKVHFSYMNDEKIEVSYNFKIEVRDTTKPVLSKRDSLTLYEGYDGNIMDNFFCGDNFDDNLKCNILGEYDVNTIGTYPAIFEAEDSSGNKDSYNFNINIIKKEISDFDDTNQTFTYFSDVFNKYKNSNTKIGIDVSKWEGDLDFKKIKDEGVEFAYIRVGHQKGIDGEYILDPKFKQNIDGFKSQNIKVGVYFFSHAKTIDEAIRQANWVYRQIRGYKIDLEVVFDWENWEGFSNYNISFYNLNKVARAFIDEINNRGYKGMLYSSKYYLENVWFDYNDVWLAHYTDNTDYKGRYKVWQLCDDGKIDGILDNVDIDVMYD